MQNPDQIENFLYGIWIFLMIFIHISAILSVAYDKIIEKEGPKFKREGNKLIRIW